jgi:hypothetical protein
MAVQHRAREGLYIPVKLSQSSQAFVDQSSSVTYRGVRAAGGDIVLPELLGGMLGLVGFRGLSKTAILRVVIRLGVEYRTTPISAYVPFLSPGILPDSAALSGYQSIASQMADGWPVAYNDLGALLRVIWDVAKAALPTVTALVSGVVKAVKKKKASTVNRQQITLTKSAKRNTK